jgi:hypothetical protein
VHEPEGLKQQQRESLWRLNPRISSLSSKADSDGLS